jgi:hypothetical protein
MREPSHELGSVDTGRITTGGLVGKPGMYGDSWLRWASRPGDGLPGNHPPGACSTASAVPRNAVESSPLGNGSRLSSQGQSCPAGRSPFRKANPPSDRRPHRGSRTMLGWFRVRDSSITSSFASLKLVSGPRGARVREGASRPRDRRHQAHCSGSPASIPQVKDRRRRTAIASDGTL